MRLTHKQTNGGDPDGLTDTEGQTVGGRRNKH